MQIDLELIDKLAMLSLIVLGAQLCEAMLGFGGTILALSLGIFLFPLNVLVPVLLPIGFCLSLYLTWRHHRDIDLSILLKRILPPALLGIPFGLAVYILFPNQIMRMAFGLFLLLFSASRLHVQLSPSRNQRPTSKMPRWEQRLWLWLGGFMQGLYASGGPMIVYYAGGAIQDKRSFRSTLSLLWLILNGLIIMAHVIQGSISIDTLQISAILISPLIAGIAIGEQLHNKITEEKFRVRVYGLLLFAGVLLLLG